VCGAGSRDDGRGLSEVSERNFLSVISDSDDLVVFARIYNQQTPNVAGTFGQAIPGVHVSELIGQGEVGRIIFMTEGPKYRANLGCANGTDENVRIFIDLYDDEGENSKVNSDSRP